MTVEVLDALNRRMSNPSLLEMVGVMAVSLVQKNIVSGSWAPNAPLTVDVKGSSKPLRDTGGLLASLAKRIEGGAVIVGTNHRAARILHDGGTITPKAARSLAIPAGKQTKAFMRMYGPTPRACIEGMKAAGYSVWIPKGKPVILARQGKGESARTHLLFILRKSVTIPARPFMRLPRASVSILEKAVARRIFG